MREATLGKVSVVHIPLAASSQCSCVLPMLLCSFEIVRMISVMGSLLNKNFGV